jgi:hypothetical protein
MDNDLGDDYADYNSDGNERYLPGGARKKGPSDGFYDVICCEGF